MQAIHADHVVSISELKKNPGAVMAHQAKPVAVLNHNKPAFYVVPVKYMEAIFEELDDRELYAKVLSRLGDLDKAVAVDLKDL
jgi:antitoxin StbD